MEKHVTIVAALRIAFGALGILAAIIIFLAVVGGGLISGDSDAMRVTVIVGPSIALVLVLVSLPGIIGGVGLLKYKQWARILVIILAILDLFNIPIGTALGIYSLWVLLQDETAQLFAAGSGSGPPVPQDVPPPD
jgi:hypothetical protein